MIRSFFTLVCIASSLAAEPRVDQYGDPLPDGAIARFGTVRYRIGSTRVLRSFAVSPDGRSLAFEDAHGVTFMDLDTGVRRASFRPQSLTDGNARFGITYSPDGKRVARLAGEVVNILEAKSGGVEITHELPKGTKACDLAFSADGKRLVVAIEGKDEILSIEIGKSNELEERPIDSSVLRLTASGRLGVGRLKSELILIDIASGKTVCRFADPDELSDLNVVIPHDESRLYLTDRLGNLQVFEATTGKLLEKIELPEGWDQSGWRTTLSLSPDGSIAYLTKHGKPTLRRDLKFGKWLRPLPVSMGGSLFARLDGKVAVLVGADGVVRRYDLETLKELPGPSGFEDCVFAHPSPDGRLILAQYESSAGYQLDLFEANGKRIWSEQQAAWQSARWSRDGRWIACVGKETIAVREPATGKVARTLQSPFVGREFSHLFFPDIPDRVVAPIDFGHSVAVFSMRTGEQVSFARPGFAGPITMSPDGEKLLFSRDNSPLWIFDMSSGRWEMIPMDADENDERIAFGNLAASEQDFQFSPDGSYVLAWKNDNVKSGNIAVLRDAETLRATRTFVTNTTGRIESAISPNGLWLAVGEHSGTLTLFDVSSGTKLGTWSGHRDYITSIGFAGAGRLLTGSGDLTAILWELKPDKRPEKPLWEALSGTDGMESYRALWAIAADPKGPDLLRSKISRVETMSPERVKQWIADLAANRYPVRESAMRSLLALGRLVEPTLRAARQTAIDAEARSRLESLLAQVRHERSHAELVQTRAVAAMELAGSDAAKKLLADWASGAPGARLTIDAKGALGRIGPSR